MQPSPHFALEEIGAVRDLIAANPWAILVSQGPEGLIASHYPVMFHAPDDDGSVDLVTHMGRADARRHGCDGTSSMLVIIQGRHGYISPSWYVGEDASSIPTWNFEAAHLHGVARVLDEAENLRVLDRLVDHFERGLPNGRRLDEMGDRAAKVAHGTTGLRIEVSRVEGKAKFSQNKTRATQDAVISALTADGPYHRPDLADAMRRHLGRT